VAGETRLIEQLSFAMPARELSLDVEHHAAVSAAIGGGLTMTLADADPSTSSHRWDLPGLWVFGALPSPAYLELLGDLGDVIPFRSNAGEWEHPVDGVSLEYPQGDSYNVVRFGDCAHGVENADEQGAFVEQLAGEGVPVTVIENAGSCARPKP
jgi:hypothetical protein